MLTNLRGCNVGITYDIDLWICRWDGFVWGDIPSFIKIGSRVQKSLGGNKKTNTEEQKGDVVYLILIF
jgi:hypothetical protein